MFTTFNCLHNIKCIQYKKMFHFYKVLIWAQCWHQGSLISRLVLLICNRIFLLWAHSSIVRKIEETKRISTVAAVFVTWKPGCYPLLYSFNTPIRTLWRCRLKGMKVKTCGFQVDLALSPLFFVRKPDQCEKKQTNHNAGYRNKRWSHKWWNYKETHFGIHHSGNSCFLSDYDCLV